MEIMVQRRCLDRKSIRTDSTKEQTAVAEHSREYLLDEMHLRKPHFIAQNVAFVGASHPGDTL
jgi:hypothetical protein